MGDDQKPIEVAVPEIQKGTVSFMSKSAFSNPAPERMKRILGALRYFCVGLITMVSGTDLFSGRQSKIICFVLGAFILLLGAVELGTGVKTQEENKQ